jgi:hypothetical protein
MEIVDNFINVILQEEIKNYFYSKTLPWNYCKVGTQEAYDNRHHFMDENTKDSSQFVHDLNNEKDSFVRMYLLHCAEDYFGRNFSDRILRVKANMLLADKQYKPDNYHIPHCDYEGEVETLIYYVNDSDGDTFVFNEKPDINLTSISIRDRITPVKGRALLFDSSYLHASSSPIISSERIIINFVFRK